MKIFGIVGWKNSGKTTLLTKLISELSKRGFEISTVKHAHHDFEIDKEGKDSCKHRKSGAKEVMVSSKKRWALMHENNNEEYDLKSLLKKMKKVDILFVEGFKNSNLIYPKLEISRFKNDNPYIFKKDKNVIAFISDVYSQDIDLPFFEINDIKKIADFLEKKFL